MSNFSPHKDILQIVSKIQKINFGLFWLILISAILSSTLIFSHCNSSIKYFSEIINFFVIIFYFIIDSILNLILIPISNSIRRDDFIDNSLGSNLSLKKSLKYYDNDEIDFGIYKLACNLFENCFYTYSLLKKRILSEMLLPIATVILILYISYIGFKQVSISLTLLQWFFSSLIFGRLISFFVLLFNLNKIQDSLIALFQNNDLKNNIERYQSLVYKNWLNYETLHSRIHANIPEELFYELNNELLEEWEQIKKSNNIK